MCEEHEDEKDNEILAELYRIREEFAAEFNYDIHAIFEYLAEQEKLHPERMANLPIAYREPEEPRAA
ncbi:MAG TPA: hypothetical protein VE913_23795 [Longimicrobium sp.]|nr:hypothetical protein [Longimicrobium sp.]